MENQDTHRERNAREYEGLDEEPLTEEELRIVTTTNVNLSSFNAHYVTCRRPGNLINDKCIKRFSDILTLFAVEDGKKDHIN